MSKKCDLFLFTRHYKHAVCAGTIMFGTILAFKVELEPAFRILYRPDNVPFVGKCANDLFEHRRLAASTATNNGKDGWEFGAVRPVPFSLPNASPFHRLEELLSPL